MADGDKNKDVIFRRIRGRVVPIRVNRSRSSGSDSASTSRKIGGGLAVSAFGAAAAGGVVQRRFQKRARKFRVQAFRAGGLADLAEGTGRAKKAAGLRKLQQAKRARAKQLIKGAKSSRFVALSAASTLLGTGLGQLIEDDKRRSPEAQAAMEFTANVTGTALAASFLLARKKLSITRLRNALRKTPSKEPDLFKNPFE